MFDFPFLRTDNPQINTAFRLALSTLTANVQPFKDGLLEKEEPVLMAGMGYVTPWTRDAAINTMNGAGLIIPEVALNTLKSVLNTDENGLFIDGQYWDKIIWTMGAWQYYLYNGDLDFLKASYEAVVNTLKLLERDEFDSRLNLFRGPACYGDGVSAYPDIYADHGSDFILHFAKYKKELCEPVGFGMPMFALSTNCLYYYSYILADKMGEELGISPAFSEKAQKMYNAINRYFWNQEKGSYNYLYDKFGGCDYQEGLGLSFALIFGLADEEKTEKIFKNRQTSPHGIPCVYPTFPRYETPDKMGFGRHSGTVWPHVQGFWADAAAAKGQKGEFEKELMLQTENALRYSQFAEVYHPIDGSIYGGRQEQGDGIREFPTLSFQTWSATAYIRNILFDLVGLKFSEKGIEFSPMGTESVCGIDLSGLRYRNATLNIRISGRGDKIKSFKCNGKESSPFIPCDITGNAEIEIVIE